MAEPLIIDPNDRDKRMVPDPRTGRPPQVETDSELDAKDGKSHHRNFVNFLATDKVPDSIFGIPVVQDASQYTEKDIEFFRKNPKAAGFYDLGDDGEMSAPAADMMGGVVSAWDALELLQEGHSIDAPH